MVVVCSPVVTSNTAVVVVETGAMGEVVVVVEVEVVVVPVAVPAVVPAVVPVVVPVVVLVVSVAGPLVVVEPELVGSAMVSVSAAVKPSGKFEVNASFI